MEGKENHQSLPFPKPPPPYSVLPTPTILLNTPYLPDPLGFGEACIAKAVMASAVGSVFGAGLGFMVGSYRVMSPPISLPGVPDPPAIPLKYVLRESWLSTARQARQWGRNMLLVGFLLAGSECCIEKFRGKHDLYNNFAGGAVSGAVLAARQGPWGIFFGSLGFALFGVGAEYLMGNH